MTPPLSPGQSEQSDIHDQKDPIHFDLNLHSTIFASLPDPFNQFGSTVANVPSLNIPSIRRNESIHGKLPPSELRLTDFEVRGTLGAFLHSALLTVISHHMPCALQEPELSGGYSWFILEAHRITRGHPASLLSRSSPKLK